jgi:2-polyprenyl-6-methoxyphenol hydroxylase-like FAD-dependent oxidoreductase
MGQNNFRVIVVGGGPVGLTAAHVLQKAGIDFILLERRPHVVIDAGSNLVLNPQGMKALSQLGLQTALDAVSSPLGIINRVDHRGRNMGDMNWFLYMKKR